MHQGAPHRLFSNVFSSRCSDSSVVKNCMTCCFSGFRSAALGFQMLLLDKKNRICAPRTAGKTGQNALQTCSTQMML